MILSQTVTLSNSRNRIYGILDIDYIQTRIWTSKLNQVESIILWDAGVTPSGHTKGVKILILYTGDIHDFLLFDSVKFRWSYI